MPLWILYADISIDKRARNNDVTSEDVRFVVTGDGACVIFCIYVGACVACVLMGAFFPFFSVSFFFGLWVGVVWLGDASVYVSPRRIIQLLCPSTAAFYRSRVANSGDCVYLGC